MSWSVIFGAVLFLSVFLSFVSCYGADCSNQTVGWSDYCYNIDNKAPYCHRSFNASPIAICVACQTDCDCDIHEYCSTNPSTFYQCVEFKQRGSSCYPWTSTQLRDPNIPAASKCAALMENGTEIDHEGVCVESVCKECQPGFSSICYGYEGVGPRRDCTLSGDVVPTWQVFWFSWVTVYNPVFSWSALFFVLIFIQVFLSFLILVRNKPPRFYTPVSN